MTYGYAAIGLVLSSLMMLAMAAKWKLPMRAALPGSTLAALVAAVPFVWITPSLAAGWGQAAGVAAQAAIAVFIGLSVMMYYFWRDPERAAPNESGIAVCPADGNVVYIRTTEKGTFPLVTKKGRHYRLNELMGAAFPNEPAWVIGIEMSFLDVHVNRCPIGGRIAMVKHIHGDFISLRKEEAQFVNERVTTIIEDPSLTVGVVQIASRLVRRINSYVKIGQDVATGERLGVIKLGSLVAIIIPKRGDVDICVRVGDHVSAGTTLLARYSARREVVL
ncbi:MAG: phosphatidylserine decarboxylase [Anaerolineae bacterium]